MKKYLTREGLEKLKKELGYLEKIKRKEISEMIKQAASQGDLTENAGYDAAKEEQGFVEGRIRKLKTIIAQAEVIEKKENGKVQFGSFVFLKSSEGKEKFQIVSPEEADILNNKISFKSPLGEALLNKKKGNIVRINTPDGKKEYKIEEIRQNESKKITSSSLIKFSHSENEDGKEIYLFDSLSLHESSVDNEQ